MGDRSRSNILDDTGGIQNRTRHYQTLSKTFSDYTTNIFYRSEILITTAENFSGQDKPNPKHWKTSGGG